MITYNEEDTETGNRNTLRKTIPFPFCPPQIPRDMTGMNPGRVDGKSATTRLSYGVASCRVVWHKNISVLEEPATSIFRVQESHPRRQQIQIPVYLAFV